jgi:predicted permease
MRALLARLRDSLRRRTIARDFDDEMAFHLAQLEQRNRERGLSDADARAAAAREFGNTLRAREDLRSQAGFPSWDELFNDLKYAWRGIVRRPMLAVSVVSVLALGLGAAATIHGLVDAIFLRPLPVSHPEELYAVTDPSSGRMGRLSRGTASRLETLLPEHSVAAFSSGARCTVQLPGRDATRSNARLVNGTFFSMLGVGPGAGRLLSAADDTIGAPTPVAVASYAWAKTNFGVPEAAVGREVIVNRVPLMIVGVLSEKFREIAVGQLTDLWVPSALQAQLKIFGSASSTSADDRPNDPDWNREERVSWQQLLVRVRPGTPSVEAALQRAWEPQRDDLAKAADEPRSRDQVLHRKWQLTHAPGGQSGFRDSFRSTGWLLGGVVAVMLVLVCTNVSGLLLVRSMSRHREIGVRLALGAGSWRVARLGFLEAGILSLLGAAGGLLLASWLLPVTAHLLASGQDLELSLGLRGIGLMSALALFTAVASALAPSLWISRVEPLRALSGNRGLGRAPLRLGRVLVVAQFALAVALVAVAAALGEELQRSLTADQGFEREQVMTALFDPASAGYDKAAVGPLLERLRTTALGVPGVKTVGFAATGILAGTQSKSGIRLRDPRAGESAHHVQNDLVTPGYFGVVGTPVLRGRDFALTDTKNSQRVALVNATFAREILGHLDPLGQVFGFDIKPSKEDWTIVGVVADARNNGVRDRVPAMFYTPATQWQEDNLHFLALRFEGTAAALQKNLQTVLARAEPGLVLSSWKTLEKRVTDDLSGEAATTKLATIFGGCALLLAGAGVAGSLGYLVVLRQRELALRMAIGADPSRVMRGVLADALRLGAIGGTAGLIAVWVAPFVPAIAAVMHGRPGWLPAVVAALVALATALIAGWIPARRAARIDPILMLKAE